MMKNTRLTPDQFRERREKLGLTPEQLAAILDTTPRAVRNWEQTEGKDMRAPNPIACRYLLLLTGERQLRDT
ncbi:putative transcriptional regulator [Sinorhizobium phage HMSP1-Susan]|nr:putative transcriptional regulator [Sinorhizobium phage HMSP1-Susan]